ncbi:hypothetical protein A3D80_04750 [Candidatus Roizmanbacteria bacterium RIFCSPHIGHO2_02_FULL_40_13b]|uniref:Mannosyl-glycoprotein endo-beta-N-acetylglucosamidase-like domain-containing protein n=1 Tax=Candidatus Roizmanbacteria bacterium RIFCSPHIGHO2_01_FULL_39_24 TaxID=1802032 RepID=A0A1F7GLC0_9BACT|nr:MAG: hypothetical protein A2799_04595 [Candidatus Roizmanbacteria bacterium RIFCSPHIGHO2_01_FULL_39_24]OGK28032.1 MAG: hypothetical protein A3D80_04750 [Candidatus Roizmanbacteria bacterium RIFCSPHIGHO2_02_FULL_40_13b]OGK50297.1 MAG: hypothetical protein A3A56_04400 [Candidatus Roizmanbacteria bacterium RIFCSPLOWO2_01_FULL_40_32]OGK56169.1 MAG: hypothetical protein A3H83_00230 [Candidatus Roizmanbacteria bacterium RIFCSPLOWO2_02_FULL_39_8]
MHSKKALILTSIFALLFFLNFALIFTYYSTSRIHTKQQELLSQIDSIAQNPNRQFTLSAAPLVLGTISDEVKVADGRAANLKNFFRQYNSPLFDFTEDLVRIQDKYGIDYRVLPAIAMQESEGCKKIPPGSHNCWGWGIYGDQVMMFSSYPEAMETVAAGLKRDYVDSGLITASAIMERYTPSSRGSWAYAVNFFLKILE